MDNAKEGDTLIVQRFDRLSTNMLGLLRIIDGFKFKNIRFISMDISLTNDNAIQNFFLLILEQFHNLNLIVTEVYKKKVSRKPK